MIIILSLRTSKFNYLCNEKFSRALICVRFRQVATFFLFLVVVAARLGLLAQRRDYFREKLSDRAQAIHLFNYAYVTELSVHWWPIATSQWLGV